MTNSKYELTSITKKCLNGLTLYQTKALKDIPKWGVKKGDLGGWIESEKNLSQKGDCWVHGNARVYEDARVYGDAQVFGYALVFGKAQVSDNAQVFGKAQVFGDALVFGEAHVYGYALVSEDAQVYGDALVYGNTQVCGSAQLTKTPYSVIRTDGYTFILAPTLEGPRIIAGCRYFTFEEAKEHWTKTRGGTPLGKESLAIVAYLKKMSKLI